LYVLIADFAVEAWLPGTPTAGVLDDHGLAQILLELEVILAPFHELGRLREVLLLPLERLLSCAIKARMSILCLGTW